MQLLLLSGEAAVSGMGRILALQLEKHQESGLCRWVDLKVLTNSVTSTPFSSLHAVFPVGKVL